MGSVQKTIGSGIKKLAITLSLLLCITGKIFSNNNNALTLWLSSGHQVTYLLDEQPEIKFVQDELRITTTITSIAYEGAAVHKFTFTHVDPNDIKSIRVIGDLFRFTEDNILSGSNLAPYSSVMVYTAEGALLVSAKANEHGDVSISMPTGTIGVYLIKTESATFKVIKL